MDFPIHIDEHDDTWAVTVPSAGDPPRHLFDRDDFLSTMLARALRESESFALQRHGVCVSIARVPMDFFGLLQKSNGWGRLRDHALQHFGNGRALTWILPSGAAPQNEWVSPALDAFTREVSVGEVYYMADHVPGCNVAIYDEPLNTFAPVSMLYALNHCLRFGDDGRLFFPQGFQPKTPDMFWGCSTFSDMNPEHLPPWAVAKMAHSVVAKFRAIAGVCDEFGPFLEALFSPRGQAPAASATPEVHMATAAFMASPINLGVLKRMAAWEIYMPFDFILLRPHITHKMGTAVAIVDEADNAEAEEHESDALVNFRGNVEKPHYAHVVENVFVGDYVCGRDLSAHTLGTVAEPMSKSVYVALVPAGHRQPSVLHIDELSEFYRDVIDYPQGASFPAWGKVASTGLCHRGSQCNMDISSGYWTKRVEGTGHHQ